MVNSTFVFLTIVMVSVLLAMTLRAVKGNLMRRDASHARPLSLFMFDAIEALMWTGAVIATVLAAPHPVTILILAILVASLLTARRLRYNEERRTLNRWLRFASDSNAALPSLLDHLASSCRSRLARQAKGCVRRLGRGQPLTMAARRAKFPFDADTLAWLASQGSDQPSLRDDGPLGLISDSHAEFDRIQDSQKNFSFVTQQFTYVIVILVLAWSIGFLVRRITVPMFEDLLNEFSFGEVTAQKWLDHAVWYGGIFMVILAIWLVLALIVRWLPRSFVAKIPWFGGWAIDQWRCEVLRCLRQGMLVGQVDRSILQSAAEGNPIRWIRSSCRQADQSLQSGRPLPSALRAGKIVTAKEQKWLTSALKNGTLTHAIGRLGADIERRQMYRWQLRVAWVVPMATVLVGGFILVHAMALFQFLSLIMRGLS